MNLKRKSLLTGVASLCIAAALMPELAQAQSAEGKQEVKEIVVTGSRIRRKELTSVQPMETVTSKDIDSKGYANVGDALNALPSVGQGVSAIGQPSTFTVGQNFVNLFNLGAQRTLTLINGQRVVGGQAPGLFTGSGAGGQVDFNTIPTAFIDRVEMVQAGGSAVYGSDAIAGVINVVLKKKVQGVEVDAQYGMAERGDAKGHRIRLTAGQNLFNDRLNIAGSYEYSETGSLQYKDRPYLAKQCSFVSNPANTGPSDGIADRIVICDRRIPEATLGGIAVTGQKNAKGVMVYNNLMIADPKNPGQMIAAQFDPTGNLVPYNTGKVFQSGVAQGGEGLNLANLTSLQTPVKRHLVNLMANAEITNNIRARGSVFYGRTEATTPITQPSYNSTQFSGSGGPIEIDTNNPFLTAQARAALLAGQPAGSKLYLSRGSNDVFMGSNATEANINTFRSNITVDGDFDALNRHFYWSTAASYGNTNGEFKSASFYQDRFLNAIDAVKDNSGAIVCRDPAARAAGCQPLNLFGLGAPSDAAKAYIGATSLTKYELSQTLFTANFGGEVVKLPAGTMTFNAGFEYRKETGELNPNTFARQGLGRSAAFAAIKGKFDTKEWYIETLVPVVSPDLNIPLINRLELDGAFRTIDNSVAGSDEAWSYGARWYPISDLMIRGQKSRSFRAPALMELYLPASTSYNSATDPGDKGQIKNGPNPAARAANCLAAFQALGLTATDLASFKSNVATSTVKGTNSGNPNLKNEVSDSWSAGFVYQPRQIKNLALTFDYMSIDITGAISNLGIASLLQSCYDSNAYPDAKYCSRITRNAAGQIDTENGYRATYINAGYFKYRGMNMGGSYSVALNTLPPLADYGDLGRLGLRVNVTKIERYDTSNTGTGQDLVINAGVFGNPKYRWTSDISYSRGPVKLNWNTQYIGESRFSMQETAEARSVSVIKAYYLNNLSVSYDITPKVTARVIVNNVFDENPTPVTGATSIGIYDLVGRAYTVGINAKF